MKNAGLIQLICLFFIVYVSAQGQTRGSIPEVLLRPGWGESSRYPVDTVIGELGQGKAPYAAYTYANSVAAGFLSGQMTHPALASVNPVLRESYLDSLRRIAPRSFRIGSGRQEPDGAVSFLIRFVGRDYGITGELYIKTLTPQIQEEDAEDSPPSAVWVFDELLLEEARSHEVVNQETLNRLDLLPYERFF